MRQIRSTHLDRINQIVLIAPDDTENNIPIEIVRHALVRSFGLRQTVVSSKSDATKSNGVVAINPDSSITDLIGDKRKILMLGQLKDRVSKTLGVIKKSRGGLWNSLWDILPGQQYDTSKGSIHYSKSNKLVAHPPYEKRDLLRYDFEKEWNNHGYGGVLRDDPIWGVCHSAEPSANVQPIAWIADQYGEHVGLYAGLIDFPDASILWFNRPVGPVDSLEWHMIETFFSNYRSEDLPCFPYLLDIPYGYDGAVCMHADCDEAISSARNLFELYQQHDFPFSLAIKTEQEITAKDISFMQDVIKAGGSVSSHSCNHYDNWGGQFQVAYNEAIESKRWIEDRLANGTSVNYAVSPFYQNPPYAVQALADAGYLGFVGGIICNDPEYLMGRSGVAPFCNGKIVSHSQQCMLHGDCYHRYGNSIAPYIEAFESYLSTDGFFGYLDHPFSKRYSYGWFDEKERLDAHAELIEHMKNAGRIWFTNLDQCLDFVRKKSIASVWVDENATFQSHVVTDQRLPVPDLCASYRGKKIRINSNAELSLS